MKFTMLEMTRSLAAYLSSYFPGVMFYEDPDHPEAKPPCLFLQQQGAEVKRKQGGRFFYTLQLDLVYLEESSKPGLRQIYLAAAEELNQRMETLPFGNQGEEVLLRTYNRKFAIEDGALHYRFELRLWLEPEKPKEPCMGNLQGDLTVE